MQQSFYWVSHHPSLIGWYDLKYLLSHILLQKHDFRTATIGFKVLYVKVFLLVESNAVLYSCQHLQPTVAKYLNTDWDACWRTIFTSYGGGIPLKPSRSFTKTWSPYFILFFMLEGNYSYQIPSILELRQKKQEFLTNPGEHRRFKASLNYKRNPCLKQADKHMNTPVFLLCAYCSISLSQKCKRGVERWLSE